MSPTFSHAILLAAQLALIPIPSNAKAKEPVNVWEDIPMEERQATECPSDPSTGGEVLYKRLLIDQGKLRKFRRVHTRTKIYSENALEEIRAIRITYSSGQKISELHARVVKPDGQSFELDESDVFEKTEKQSKKEKLRSISFVMPNAEVGDIIELKYRLTYQDGYFNPWLFVYFQEEWPIRRIELKVRPHSQSRRGFKWISRKCSKSLIRKDDGFYELAMENVEAFPEEADQIPDRDGKSWFLIYVSGNSRTGDSYWDNVASELYKESEARSNVTLNTKKKARELTAGLESRNSKLKALYDFCCNEIINTKIHKKGQLSHSKLRNPDDDITARVVLKQGYGTPPNINSLFCSLARACGFDARLAIVSNRALARFSKNIESTYIALPDEIVAVRNGGSWEFLDPSVKYLEYGKLDWRNQGAVALVANGKAAEFLSTDVDEATETFIARKGNFQLDSSGTLMGTVTFEATGQYNYEFKKSSINESEETIKELYESHIKAIWPNSEFKDLEISGLHTMTENLRIQFSINVPLYADVIGKRIFFQPSAFRKNDDPKYPLSTRKTDLAYEYRYSTKDHVEITLPPGYAFEAPSAPHPVKVEHLGDYKARISINKTANTLIYDRTFQFHGIRYPSRTYPLIKKFFDNLHKQDGHTLNIVKAEDTDSAL